MKKFIVYSLLFMVFGFFYYSPLTIYHIPTASAHLFGQPAFFKVNGQYSNLYPVPVASVPGFDLPQDLAPDNYLVNQPINFEMDATRLPAPPDVVEKTKYAWDFADGSKASGLKNSHTYLTPGSYIIKITADDGTTPTPQLLESILVNVLPNKDYQLPQAIILVNGKQSKDPLTDILQSDFKDNVNLDGSMSTPSSDITEYFWDFGDQKSDTGAKLSHKYPGDLSQSFVVLRVKNKDGFLADQFVEVQNESQALLAQPLTKPKASAAPTKTVSQYNQLPFTLLGIFGLIIIALMARQYFLGRHRGTHQ